MPSRNSIEAEIAAQVAARGAGKTICPSEVARALSDDWRGLMPEVRAVAGAMVRDGRIIATQGGAVIDPERARGPIRLGLPESRG
ncbi:DUF3253 domain-containing protein [Sulfitobacter aestuarii]|uniref:DUF3253 domain-containing protein n=1 Tax=Sulfitobacter aestuarii TaxID=2161676 RepID=A0ABW5U503_9RHOB